MTPNNNPIKINTITVNNATMNDHQVFLNLFDLDKETMRKYSLDPKDFPIMRPMTDGTLFIESINKYTETLYQYYIRWMVFDSEQEVVSSVNYPYIQIPKKGYLVKLRVPITSDEIKSFNIDYIVELDNIEITQETYLQLNSNTENGNSVNEKKFNHIKPIQDISKIQKIYSKMQENTFLYDYITSAIRMMY